MDDPGPVPVRTFPARPARDVRVAVRDMLPHPVNASGRGFAMAGRLAAAEALDLLDGAVPTPVRGRLAAPVRGPRRTAADSGNPRRSVR